MIQQWREEAAQRLQEHIYDERILRMREYIQHGSISTYEHSILVAYYSWIWMRRLHLKCDEQALLRGALLHDYYLYDWHKKEEWHRWHGFRHPAFAVQNASRDFELTKKEKEIILRHMWPLTVIPPRCREAWLVNGADTFISLIETIADRRKSDKMKQKWIEGPLTLSRNKGKEG